MRDGWPTRMLTLDHAGLMFGMRLCIYVFLTISHINFKVWINWESPQANFEQLPAVQLVRTPKSYK